MSDNTLISHVRCPEFEPGHGHWICTAGVTSGILHHRKSKRYGSDRDGGSTTEELNRNRQLNVLHQVASFFSRYDIQDIAIRVYICNPLLIRLLKTGRHPMTGFALFGTHQVGAVPGFPSTLCFT
ncbi:hypothetical protein T265_10447 [Opisthorchis viverrini]|uniref:Uncharacterized protein n=1 Tax=Opisthorchis viverrini TaxID=6198 RepID=A0A074ZDA7_OPIVI|nr:hypothetical protein T265_10447 [Opisthorchis viverrini]KER21170.1 hypothetical protein T265_10447 [Opisthorchis viverrini]